MRAPVLTTLLLLMACGTDPVDQLPPRDGGPADSGPADQGVADSGALDGGPSDGGTTDAGPPDGGPADLGPRDGGSGTGACEGLPCRDRLLDDQAFEALAVPSPEGACQYDLELPFITSIDGSEPTYYLDPRVHAAPIDFLRRELPARYGTMDVEAYFRDFEREDLRTHWIGRIRRLIGAAPHRYAVDVYGSGYWGAQDAVVELQALLARLATTFPMPLGYGPSQYGPIRQAAGFSNPPFVVHSPITCPGESCPAGPGPCLVIPPGAELCGHHQENRAINSEHQNRIRVQLTPGAFRLVPDAPAPLIAGGVFGPEATAIVPGAATARSQQSGPTTEWWVEQNLIAGALTINLRLDVGARTEPLILREPFLENLFGYGSVEGGTFADSVYLQTCSGSGWNRYYAEASLGGGDRLRIEYRHQLPFAGSGPWLLTGAEVILGGQPRRVESSVDLLYAGVHHNWDNQFWILFDEPVRYQGTDIHGLWVDEPGTTCCPVDSIRTLGPDLTPVHTLDGSDYQRAPKLF